MQAFADDPSIFSPKTIKQAEEINFLCIEAVFFALEKAGWLIKLEVSTFMNPKFVFLGLFWNLDESASIVQNNRISSILSYRVPRSMPELASRLATMQYYQNYLPLIKRIAILLYYIVKTGTFVWERQHAEAYINLLYIMSTSTQSYLQSCETSFING